ncbi:BLUF domain-containing protein [Pseudoalteromonas xiamenensis]|uniref:BLUF domain-containing protein n=1 Tax=Pseudoalteromonas xiamenensis TaxID=882626 RepID=UPI0027E3BDC1|nr:BLUF domain-containing protein [Pseudoalteromonas xiamenensis]WMN59630.1 BLUF domain-containing protein [Pseudoalteromonas xiamenensis]
MFLVRLVYVSTFSKDFQSQDIEAILNVSRENNLKKYVTGMLCFNRKYFLQCIEGTRQNVNETYNRIVTDPRHHNLIILDYKEIAVREFSDWSMGYIPESKLTNDININFGGTSVFSPYDMSGESAFMMMLALKSTVPAL